VRETRDWLAGFATIEQLKPSTRLMYIVCGDLKLDDDFFLPPVPKISGCMAERWG
jgi:hypothetical protein